MGVLTQRREGAKARKGFMYLCLCVSLSAAVGAQTPLRLPDLGGTDVDPFADRSVKAVVFLFTRTDCPISNRYAPEVRRIHERFAASGVRFWLVYCDPDEPTDAIRAHISEYGYTMGALRDPRHALVALVDAHVTPEVAVAVPERAGWRIAYHGRIDDRYVALGTMRPEPTTHDLEEVLGAVVRGARVETHSTVAIGCYISDLR